MCSSKSVCSAKTTNVPQMQSLSIKNTNTFWEKTTSPLYSLQNPCVVWLWNKDESVAREAPRKNNWSERI
jgi:hypothetical protein